MRQDKIDEALCIMANLTDEERLNVMDNFCKECGCDDPKCQCWNDE